MSINDKIKQVLLTKNLSPSYLADDIGVQRSSISHILSGRNRPSLDVIQKIVRRFPEFSYEWFLDDDTHLATDEPGLSATPNPQQQAGRSHSASSGAISVFPIGQTKRATSLNGPIVPKLDLTSPADEPGPASPPEPPVGAPADRQIDRILIFYTNGTFREYTPAR